MMLRVAAAGGLLLLSACDSRTLGILAAAAGAAAQTSQPAIPSETLMYERDFRSGMNKICVYRGVTGEQFEAVGAADLCPLTR